MKKFITFALVFLSLMFVAASRPQTSFAACRFLQPGESCSGDFGGILCQGSTFNCCDTQAECTANTTPPKYKCDPQLGCIQDPNGTYDSSGQCSDACIVKSTWDCETVNNKKQCIKKGPGVGQYSDLPQCAKNCELTQSNVCGLGAYLGQTTFCSVAAIGRPIAPGFTGCRSGEYCVTDAASTTCSDNESIDTAIGCIPITIEGFTQFFLRWALGIGGGIAFLMIIAGGFIIMTSAGDPEKLQNGKQMLTAAISGIVLIIFSVFILRIIGVNILGIF